MDVMVVNKVDAMCIGTYCIPITPDDQINIECHDELYSYSVSTWNEFSSPRADQSCVHASYSYIEQSIHAQAFSNDTLIFSRSRPFNSVSTVKLTPDHDCIMLSLEYAVAWIKCV